MNASIYSTHAQNYRLMRRPQCGGRLTNCRSILLWMTANFLRRN